MAVKRFIKVGEVATVFLLIAAVIIGGCGGSKEPDPIDPATVVTDSFTDLRDSKTYRTVKIGSQTWMAENLNYATDNSWCYDGADSNCVKYGRLYNWNAALKACPAGWRLPSGAEWDDLTRAVGGTLVRARGASDHWSNSDYWGNKAGAKLKSKSGWRSMDDTDFYGIGTDDYGFSAMPGGLRHDFRGHFDDVGDFGFWWSATKRGISYARNRFMCFSNGEVNSHWEYKTSALSVRCVRD